MVILICLLFLVSGCTLDVSTDTTIAYTSSIEQDILGYYIGTNNTRYDYRNNILTIIYIDNNIAVDYYVENLQLFNPDKMPKTDRIVLGNLIIGDKYIDAYMEGKLYKTYNLNKINEYAIGDYKKFINKVTDLFEAVSNKSDYIIGIDMSGNPYITSNIRTVYYDINNNIQLNDNNESCISYIQFYKNIIEYKKHSQLLDEDYNSILIPLDDGNVKVLGQ